MSRVELVKSLALWTRRAALRRSKWAEWRKREKNALTPALADEAHEFRVHWFNLYKDARTMVGRRARQIASLRPATMSSKGLDFLIREEGVVPFAYNDPAGHATFGVGHLLHLGPVTASDEAKWGTKKHPKSREFVRSVLEKDLGDRYEPAVKSATQNKLRKPHQFDACVSLCFNIGVGGFIDSTVAREIRAGNLNAAGSAFRSWNKPAILKPRREREIRLFRTGRYT